MKVSITIPSLLVVSASAAAITSDSISSRKLLNRSKLSKEQSTTVSRKLEGKAEKQSDAKSAKEEDSKKKKKRDRKKVKGEGTVVAEVVGEMRFNNGDEKTNSIQLPITMTPSTSKPSVKPTATPSVKPTATPSLTPTGKPTSAPSIIAVVKPPSSPPLPEPSLVPTYNPTVSDVPTATLSACPNAYDTSKTDYVGGDKIEAIQDAPGYIFECDVDKVVYCNIAKWDDSLLEQDVDAKEKWNSAWVNVGKCITNDDNVVAPSMTPSVTTITDTYTLPNDDTDTISTTASPTTMVTCPPAYDMTKTTYVEGEMVTLNDHIFECMTLHVTYCNIAEWDDSLLTTDPNAFEMWDNAWMMVGPCSVTGSILTELPVLEGDDSGGLPILPTTTLSPSMASTVMVSTQISKVDTMLPTMAATPYIVVDTLPACPPAYDMTKTTYVEGEMVTLNDHIFECMTLHVTYCNIAEWDDSLLTTDPNAFEMWDNAWVLVSPCTVTGVVDVEEVIDDNDDKVDVDDDIDDIIVQVEDDSDDSINDLAEPPVLVLPTITQSPTMAPSVMVSTQISEDTHPTLSPTMTPPGDDDALSPSPTMVTTLPPCPDDYDITKTTYVGGDLVKLSGNVFECQVDLVKYCNIGVWDDSLLAEDENAEASWNKAWVFFSECTVEVSGDSDS